MRFITLLLLCCFYYTVPVFAQATVQDLCKNVTAHTPDSGVNYNPADAEIPANINAITAPIKPEIYIPIDINLAERYGINVPNAEDLDSNVAIVKIDQNGNVYYNGQNISASVAEGCKSHVNLSGAAKKPDGHKAPVAIGSKANDNNVSADEDGQILQGGAY